MDYRTVWISDLHLGTRGCDAEGLLAFLRHTEFERLYLVGDVVDLWRLRREHYWPQSHSDVVQKILRKARKGAQVVWIPGNHDEFCRNFGGLYGNVVIKDFDVYRAADGRRLLILHGHEFDAVTTSARWLSHLGDAAYTFLLKVNRPLNAVRNCFGLNYWSLSMYAKARVKNAVSFISRFEDAVTRYAAQHRADGVVCGHIHTPAMKQMRDVAYYNTGDWVENSTVLVEHYDGRMELVSWRGRVADEPAVQMPAMLTPSPVAELETVG
jgi:UDP-2,3-diacylglucosamine pyrophosphatase LpxH